MAVSTEDCKHLEQLIVELRRRQRVLEMQRARFGENAVPAYIVTELEDIAGEITRHEAELHRLCPGATSAIPPYLGLLTFQETDAARFFGRDRLVAELVERVRRAPFLAVLGASGSGKSSLVRAGLLPQLKAGALEGSARWRYVVLKPGARPLDALAAELARLQGGDLDLALHLRRALSESDDALLLAADILLDRAANQRLVLLVDQFEELWTQAPADQRDICIRLLLAASAAPDTPLLIVLTMRADFLHRAIEQRPLAERIERHVVLVSPMQPQELRDAIVRPAEGAGGRFEPGLVEELIAQVRDRPGALPLLEYTLLELWKRQAPDGLLTWAAYRVLGGVEGALAARADTILREHYTPAQQAELRQILLRLVQPGEDVADTRRRVQLDDLVPAGESLDALQLLLQPLVDERLLVTAADRQPLTDPSPPLRAGDGRLTDTGEGETSASAASESDRAPSITVEIAHEALIRAWPTFGTWIGEARADLRFQLQLEAAAKEWATSDHNDDLLWGELRLAQADAWIERATPRLNARDQSFLDASRAAAKARREAEDAARQERERLLEARAAAERRNASRLRVFLTVAAVLLQIVAGMGVYAQSQTNNANIFAARSARSAELSATAEAVAQANAAQAAKERAAAQAQARIAKAQANAGESLFELGRGNADRALLLARASVLTDTQLPLLTVRAIREATQRTVPGVLLRGHTGGVLAVAWSPDGKQVATSSVDQTARIWDVASGQPITTLAGHTSLVFAVAWSPDGKQLVTGSADNTAGIWDVASGQSITTLVGHTSTVFAVAWSPDGKQIVTGSADNTVRVWDVVSGQSILTLQGDTGSVFAVAWSPDGKQIVTGSVDNTAGIWDVASGQSIMELHDHTDSVLAVAWSPDGKQIMTGSGDKTARIWDVASGQSIMTLQGHTSSVSAVAWSPDGKQVATGSSDKTARIWDVASGQSITTLQGHTGSVTAVAWNLDGKRIVTGSDDNTVRIWDMASGQPITTLQGHTSIVYAAGWSPDGKKIVTGSEDTTARIWNVASGQSIATLQGHTDGVDAVAWSPDGKQLATGSYDRTARIWDVVSGQPFTTLQGHMSLVLAVAWSPDGKQLVTGSVDQTARIWDVASGQPFTTLHDHTSVVRAVAWSPDGKQIVTSSDDRAARIWDVASGQLLTTLHDDTSIVLAVAWGPDGKQLATGSSDTTARIWNVASGQVITTLQGHTGSVTAVAWSPDGKQLATASADNTARIWDVASGQPITTLEGHTDRVNAVAWSPDGKQIVTGSGDNTVKIWLTDNRPIIAELTRRVCNLFTDDEIRTEIPAWRGCAAELGAVKNDLAEYDRLRPTH